MYKCHRFKYTLVFSNSANALNDKMASVAQNLYERPLIKWVFRVFHHFHNSRDSQLASLFSRYFIFTSIELNIISIMYISYFMRAMVLRSYFTQESARKASFEEWKDEDLVRLIYIKWLSRPNAGKCSMFMNFIFISYSVRTGVEQTMFMKIGRTSYMKATRLL